MTLSCTCTSKYSHTTSQSNYKYKPQLSILLSCLDLDRFSGVQNRPPSEGLPVHRVFITFVHECLGATSY